MTLFEIVEAVKNNSTVSRDDLRYALLALDALHTFERMAVERLAEGVNTERARYQVEESFRRSKTAFASEPRAWLGPNNLPESDEYQRRRAVAFKILKAVERSAP